MCLQGLSSLPFWWEGNWYRFGNGALGAFMNEPEKFSVDSRVIGGMVGVCKFGRRFPTDNVGGYLGADWFT